MRACVSQPSLLSLLLCFFLLAGLSGEYARKKVDFDLVVQQALKLSKKPYNPPRPRLPDPFLDLDYDGYRKIVWNPEESLWKKEDLNFRLEMFHPGYLFKMPVKIHEFSDSHVQAIPFTSEFFEYGDPDIHPRRISRQAHYAGFRLLFPLNENGKFDEVLSFLGASYFRALGAGQRYGKSARALALNTGLDTPEEFPVFREFWIGKPEFESVTVQLFGLLDSPSVTGAYQFEVQPGKATMIDVKATLFFRYSVEWIGLAPLTSMYWYGENNQTHYQDFRPEVHDSDGLLIETEEGVTWRALANDGRKRQYRHSGNGVEGFGLMQRDREFDHYQDLEAWYQARPSVWIEPREDWAPGSVQLIEFPTDNEFFDNVVAAWVPEENPVEGQPFTFAYRMHWTREEPVVQPLARVVSTRFGRDPDGGEGTRFVMEFSRPPEQLDWSAESLAADFQVSGDASISEVRIVENPLASSWRVVFQIQGSKPAELVCRLLKDETPVSETWSYPWKAN